MRVEQQKKEKKPAWEEEIFETLFRGLQRAIMPLPGGGGYLFNECIYSRLFFLSFLFFAIIAAI